MAPALLILLGATVILRAGSLADKKPSLLPPTNFTIKVTGLSQVLLHWESNPDQEPTNIELGYHVRINAPQEEDYETRNTESKRVTVLHKGFSASVQTVPWNGQPLPASSWVSAELKAPPGSPETSIMNLTCTTNTTVNNRTPLRPYQVSLHCSWLAGKDAPEDTQYFLYYRYGSWTEECQEYRKDSLNRNTACWFPRTFISSRGSEPLAVHANGSSKYATIKPFDQLFALHAIDRVNPPVNVTAETEGLGLSIQWEKPVSAFPIHCFEYEVKIYNTRKNYSQTEKIATNTFTSIIDDISKYSIQVRATVSSVCRQMGFWSEWSQPIYVDDVKKDAEKLKKCPKFQTFSNTNDDCSKMKFVKGNDDQKPSTEWFLIALMAAICFILLSFSFICKTAHLWTRLFPPVPEPKSSIQDFFVIVSSEKTVSTETEIEVISYVEEPGFETLEDSVF